jgi:hypothetical protein
LFTEEWSRFFTPTASPIYSQYAATGQPCHARDADAALYAIRDMPPPILRAVIHETGEHDMRTTAMRLVIFVFARNRSLLKIFLSSVHAQCLRQ